MVQETADKKKVLNPGKDEKGKKRFDDWGYWLAWGSFASGLLAAFITLAKRTDAPKKNEYYK